MPLSAARPGLELDIKAAFEAVKGDGEQDAASPDAIIATLASDLATAIHNYTSKALVKTTVSPGIMVGTAGSPAVHMGATVATGTGIGELK